MEGGVVGVEARLFARDGAGGAGLGREADLDVR
jgi:hypothetical protein